MNKTNILNLICSSLLLISSIIGIVRTFVEVPTWLFIAQGIIILAAIVLYPILIVKLIKEKQKGHNK